MAEGRTLNMEIGVNFNFIRTNFDIEKAKRREKQGFVLEGGGGCFDRDQLVITANGSKEISQIKVGDKVLSYNEQTDTNEFKEVTATHKHNNSQKCIEITLKNGNTIRCTESHEFYYEEQWVNIITLLNKLHGNLESNT